MATEHAAGYCCSFRADEAAAFAVRTYARPQQLHSLESESDDMRGDTSLVLREPPQRLPTAETVKFAAEILALVCAPDRIA